MYKQEARTLVLALTSTSPNTTKKLSQTLNVFICKMNVWTGLVAP